MVFRTKAQLSFVGSEKDRNLHANFYVSFLDSSEIFSRVLPAKNNVYEHASGFPSFYFHLVIKLSST